MVLNGTIGARLHIAFPVLNRSSFGFWLSYFSVVSRVVLAMFWFGVQVRIIALECIRTLRAAIIDIYRFGMCLSNAKSNVAFHCKYTEPFA